MALDAHNRSLPDWFTRLRTGQLKLPRFQRLESWSYQEVDNLLETVLAGRPIGAVLTLAVGDREKFVSRGMEGAPDPQERPVEHLLDGQQRITALWKSLKDLYMDRTYYALIKSGDDNSERVTSRARWLRNGIRYPIWADKPDEVYKRGLAPISLLYPDDALRKIDEWCSLALAGSNADDTTLRHTLYDLANSVKETNLPYLELPVDTPPDDAIDVFIKMNTSSVRLTTYDIVVAQVEAETGESLRNLEGALRSAVPAAARYVNLPNLILRVSALREGRPPTVSSFFSLNFALMVNEWDDIQRGIENAVSFLEQERIFDGRRLPTVPVVQVLASIWSMVPREPDARGYARTILRRYLWRSFFTNRYERATNNAAFQDFRGLKSLLVDKDADAKVPIFDDTRHPVAEVEELLDAGWPRQRNTLARAILAVSMRDGGLDFADGEPAGRDSLQRREYHHLFPYSLLRNDGQMENSEVHRALNCALVTWNTNRTIAAKEPVAYLRERSASAPLGEEEVRVRIASHAIPYDALNVGGYADIACEEERADSIRADYKQFLQARAEMIHSEIVRLCNGEEV